MTGQREPAQQHSRLSPSASRRWLHCPGSVPWEAELPDESSEAADEGTAAHLLAEARLKNNSALLEKAQSSPYYCEAMESAIDTYVDYIHELTTKGAMRFIEARLDIFPPDCWGTSDCVICLGDTLHVVDLKFGKGVRVAAEGNPQCLLYAWGAVKAYDYLFDFKRVCMHIVQPRLDSVSCWEIEMGELAERIAAMLPRVQAAREAADTGRGDLCAGEHCRFCKAASRCATRARWAVIELLNAIDGEREVTSDSIGHILTVLPAIEKWIKAVKDGAFEAAMRGTPIPGYKLVAGRATRKITDCDEAARRLIAAGFAPEQVYALRGLTDLERAVGKKELTRVLDGVLVRGEARPTLVSASDPRSAWSAAAADFAPIN